MSQSDKKSLPDLRSAVTITVVGVAVSTLVVIFAGLFIGLWLDALLHTKPVFTLTLTILSIPVTIFLIFRVVRIATNRLKPVEKNPSEENGLRGKDSA